MADNMRVAWSPYPQEGCPINAEFTHPALTANSIGDLLYWDAVNLVVKPANLLADLGTAALMQAAFAKLFLGMANSKELATDTVAENARILIDLIIEFPCVSGSNFNIGDYVGPSYASGALNPQQVAKVSGPQLAIGRVVKAYPASAFPLGVSLVKCRIMSRYLLGMMDRFNTVGAGQAPGPTVLTDDNSPITVDMGCLLNCTPTVARTKTLPLESVCAGMEFYITNLGTNTLTLQSSASTAIKGNGAIPTGKSAQLWCDGTNWTGLVSA